MLATLLLAAVVSPSANRLSIAPWTGKNLATTTSSSLKYRLTVQGRPNSRLRLQSSNVAKGWLAAFCTPSVCAPIRVDVVLPNSGQAAYQFELIREEPTAAAESGARITGDGGASVTVPAARLP